MTETDVFISYKREDAEFARELKGRLEAKKYLVFLDQTIAYGREWRGEINKHLENTLLIVVLTSPLSMSSAYVTYEWCYGCMKLGKDFHWIQIVECSPADSGMFGLLLESRQAPFKCNTTNPTDNQWNEIVKSIESRLKGIKAIRRSGRIVTHGKKPYLQVEKAALFLGDVKEQYHMPLARNYLSKGLTANIKGYGPVQRDILKALEKIGGDLSTIPYLVQFLREGHDSDIIEHAEQLLHKFSTQNSE